MPAQIGRLLEGLSQEEIEAAWALAQHALERERRLRRGKVATMLGVFDAALRHRS